jgi:hypothetical protein
MPWPCRASLRSAGGLAAPWDTSWSGPRSCSAKFISYLEDAGAGTITTADALTWAALPRFIARRWRGLDPAQVAG